MQLFYMSILHSVIGTWRKFADAVVMLHDPNSKPEETWEKHYTASFFLFSLLVKWKWNVSVGETGISSGAKMSDAIIKYIMAPVS